MASGGQVEMHPGALACQKLDPLNLGVISCYFSSFRAAKTGCGRRGRERGNIYPGAQKEQFSQNTQGPGQPGLAFTCPSISLSKYLEGGEVPKGFCAHRSAPVRVPALMLLPLGCPGCSPQISRGWPCPLPGHSYSTPLSASWEPGIFWASSLPCSLLLPCQPQELWP